LHVSDSLEPHAAEGTDLGVVDRHVEIDAERPGVAEADVGDDVTPRAARTGLPSLEPDAFGIEVQLPARVRGREVEDLLALLVDGPFLYEEVGDREIEAAV